MPESRSPDRRPGGDGLAMLAFGALAIGCCGVPALVALAGSVAIGALIGVGGAILTAVALVTLAVIRVRARRRAYAPRPPTRQPAPHRRR